MPGQPTTRSLSRRTALAGLAAGGLGTALAPTAIARQASPEAMATHPMVGAWLGITPGGPAPLHILASGAFLGSSGPISVDADGVITYASPQTGTWEPAGDRRIHFTSVQSTYDAAGAYTGTVTIDGYPEASEDGETFHDPATEAKLTIRDPAGAVVTVIAPLPPVYGSRLRPGEPVFLAAPPEAATPPDSSCIAWPSAHDGRGRVPDHGRSPLDREDGTPLGRGEPHRCPVSPPGCPAIEAKPMDDGRTSSPCSTGTCGRPSAGKPGAGLSAERRDAQPARARTNQPVPGRRDSLDARRRRWCSSGTRR